MGHDSFSIINGDLVREFPTYVGTDTQSLPTGQRKKVIYSLNERGGVYAITFTKDVRASTTPIVSTTTVLH